MSSTKPLLSPQVAAELERHRGEWVAFRPDAFLAYGSSYQDVAVAEAADVVIMMMPEGDLSML